MSQALAPKGIKPWTSPWPQASVIIAEWIRISQRNRFG
jgi:hypothetical protein